MVSLAKKLNVRSVFVQPIILPNNNPISKKLQLNGFQRNQFRVLLKKAIILAQKMKIENNFEQLVPEVLESSKSYVKVMKNDAKLRYNINTKRLKCNLLKSLCLDPWIYMGINVDGRIKICPIDGPKKHSFYVFKDGIKKAWFSKKYSDIRQDLLNGKKLSYCRKCCGSKLVLRREIRKKILRRMHNMEKNG
jgi:hypothetical protein